MTLSLDALETDVIAGCRRCGLCRHRHHIVFGEGPEDAEVMLIGEAPGRHEDQTGRPFVGRSGQLLSRMLNQSQLGRESVYITNTVKCQPPGNRSPRDDEKDACFPFLAAQITCIQPSVLITAGGVASRRLCDDTHERTSMWRLIEEEQTFSHPHEEMDLPVYPVYHPAYALRQDDDQARDVIEQTVECFHRIYKEHVRGEGSCG